MKINRRQAIAGAIGAATVGTAFAAKGKYAAKAASAPSMDALAKIAAKPVFRGSKFDQPVIIQSLELLQLDKDYVVRVRAKNGAEGLAVCNPPRADYLAN